MLLFTARMIGHMMHGAALRAAGKFTARPMAFRCWPVDLDVYLHMNNANYLRVAELSRWKQMAMTGLVGKSMMNGWMFLIAEQSIRYSKPITPFQPYIIRSKLEVLDDKWIHYHHYFESAEGSKRFAHIEMRAVVKHTSGKTVRPSEILDRVPELESWVTTPEAAAARGSGDESQQQQQQQAR